MTHNVVGVIKRNVITAGIIVTLPLLVAFCLMGILIWKGIAHGWGYGFIAILLAILIEYPYLKLCDRYFFK